MNFIPLTGAITEDQLIDIQRDLQLNELIDEIPVIVEIMVWLTII
ncbi:hypothetical protein [Rossellomorea aquimaris]|nr:hypothetical protein [Rossellomorea aquimaris]